MNNQHCDHTISCIVCNSSMMQDKQHDWLFWCEKCSYYSSSIKSQYHQQEEWLKILESLSTLRQHNFTTLLKVLSTITDLKNKRILDIGCANGLFITLAKHKGMKVVGIEPLEEYAHSLNQQGFDVICDSFPPKKKIEQQFDIVVFNDVFEHIQDLTLTLKECYNYLNDNGLLIINIPNSNGIFYKTATLLSKIGINNPLERLWQKGSFSPHLHYFNQKNLSSLCDQHGFREVKHHACNSITIDGLWNRLGEQNKCKKMVMWLIIVSLSPILRFLPQDTNIQFFRKK